MRITYEYGARGEMPPLKLHWYQGEEKPRPWQDGAIPKWDSGVLFEGSKGMLLADYGRTVLLPEKDFHDFARPEPSIPKSLGHYAEWIHACKTGRQRPAISITPAGSPRRTTSATSPIAPARNWIGIPAKLYAPNVPEAEPFIHREYRKGWTLA